MAEHRTVPGHILVGRDNPPTRELSHKFYKVAVDKLPHTKDNKIDQRDLDDLYRHLAIGDLYFLMVMVLGRKDVRHDWIFQRIREVEKARDGYLDLWFRGGFKSSLITLGMTIQDILANPEITVGIFSYNRPIAKAFLRQIKREFEANEMLRRLFPDIIWEKPERDAPSWSEDAGIILKRKGNPKEPIDCNEVVLTVSGWKRHGDLIVGDKVFGPDGNPTTVVAVTEKWIGLPCYSVRFGSQSVVAAGTHKWEVSKWHCTRAMRRDSERPEERFEVYTTEELARAIERNGKNRPAVQVTQPLKMPESDLLIDPYMLGVWLGDGSRESARFVCAREDFEHFSTSARKAGHEVHIYQEDNTRIHYQLDKRDKSKNCLRGHDIDVVGRDGSGRCKACNGDRTAPYTVDTFPWRLRRLGVFGKKFVPNQYLFASETQRMALLQGLMDTDGCASDDGCGIFANTNENLSEAVYFLAASLGMKPTIKRRERPYKGQPHVMWWVTFQVHADRAPFRLARKIENCSQAVNHPRRRRRMISAVERVPSREVSCIQVDNADGCYLVGKSLITTHNSTIEAWGLVDAQPTSRHFRLMVYDDVVTADSVTTPDMIHKVTTAWETSRNLGTEGGATRYIGTRWAFNDTYKTIIDRGAAIERRHPATADGTMMGEPVFLSKESLAEKRREMGVYVFSAQMLLDPAGDRSQGFREEWITFTDVHSNGDGMNKYILVDPASAKKKTSDYTAMAVIGLASDDNYYLLDAVRDRLTLRERGDALFALHRRWKPRGVGYERYGMMGDIEYLNARMEEENYRFDITELGGQIAKNDRIKRMVPIFEAGRFLLPPHIYKLDYEGKRVDLVQAFLNDEYRAFPVGLHDDLFDAISRVCDAELGIVWPKVRTVVEDRYASPRRRGRSRNISWLAA